MYTEQQFPIDPNDHQPLHKQVQMNLLTMIDNDEIDGRLPSPDQLARALMVCPGSIRRAYENLVEAGVFEREHFCYSVAEFN